ncbi:hypothetical protein [Streptomyces gardneri]|uniref:hypothetical protein n=1 Tax=Streptomyces gardneri TaxID=66892 RepID=UPI0033D53F81
MEVLKVTRSYIAGVTTLVVCEWMQVTSSDWDTAAATVEAGVIGLAALHTIAVGTLRVLAFAKRMRRLEQIADDVALAHHVTANAPTARDA